MKTDDNDVRLVDDYMALAREAVCAYGSKTLVLMQNGGFFEVFDNKLEGSHQLDICQACLFLNVAQKGKLTDGNGMAVYMAGFAVSSLPRYKRMLLERGFTIQIVTQSDEMKEKRQLVQIVSPGFDDEAEGGAVVAAVILSQVAASVTRYDTQINRIDMFEVRGDDWETTLFKVRSGLSDRGACSEIELSLQGSTNPLEEESLQRLFPGTAVHLRQTTNRYLFDRRWQRVALESHYKHLNTLGDDIFHKLDVQHESKETIASLVRLLTFARAHDEQMTSAFPLPNAQVVDASALRLPDGVLRALHVVEGDNMTMMRVYGKAVRTHMGQRALRNRLRSPISDVSVLRARHDELSAMVDHAAAGLVKWDSTLAHMGDMARMACRVNKKQLRPSELHALIGSHFRAQLLLDDCETTFPELIRGADRIREALSRMLSCCGCYISPSLLPPELRGGETAEEDPTVGRFGEFDVFSGLRDVVLAGGGGGELVTALLRARERETQLADQIKTLQRKIDATCNAERCTKLEMAQGTHQLTLTPHRAKQLPAGWKTVSCGKGQKLQLANEDVLRLLNEYHVGTVELADANRCLFEWFLAEIRALFFKDHAIETAECVGHMDMVHGVARHAIQRHYCRPEILHGADGALRVQKMRHPIIECLVDAKGRPFVTNDLSIDSLNSVLLYGVNSVGKSSLLKAVAYVVLLAQCGLFVPCLSCSIAPFTAMTLHIGGQDDMFRAQSTFVKECEALNRTLTHSREDGRRMLFLADELLTSTEDVSAVKIVSSLLHVLHQRRSTVVFATHMFSLQESPVVAALHGLKNWHMSVAIEGGNILFDRTLKRGLPDVPEYGRIIASHILRADQDLLAMMQSARHERAPDESSAKVSRYNPNSIANCCVFCNYRPVRTTDRPLEWHHIEEQRSARGGLVPSGRNVHAAGNLAPTCPTCHDDIDRGLLVVDRFVDTLSGLELQWHRV